MLRLLAGPVLLLLACEPRAVEQPNSNGPSGPTGTSATTSVTGTQPLAFNYTTNPAIYQVAIPITPNVPTPVLQAVFSEASLPPGLALDPTNGTISGTPTTEAPATAFSITAASELGSAITQLNLTVLPKVTVDVLPATASIPAFGSLQLAATLMNTSVTTVTWTASGGSVSDAGLFTAPAQAGVYVITATSVYSPASSATATITVTPVGVSVMPLTSSVNVNGTVAFTATVAGLDDTAVVWSVEEAGGGSFPTPGNYKAPTVAGIYHVIATSAADDHFSARVEVKVAPVLYGYSPSQDTRTVDGSTLTLTGTGFGTSATSNKVTLTNSEKTSGFSAWSNTSLSFAVPTNTESGPVKVTVNGVESNAIEVPFAWRDANPNNTFVADAGMDQYGFPLLASDGAHGAYVAWYTTPNASIYATWKVQRVSSTGRKLFTNPITILPSGTQTIWTSAIAPDGHGGLIFCGGTDTQVVLQRMDPDGNLMWGGGGVAVNDTTASVCKIGVDAEDRLFVMTGWSSVRLFTLDGNQVWANKTTVPTGDTFLYNAAAFDPHDGVFQGYVTDAGSLRYDVKVVKVSPTGSLPWGASGVSMATTTRMNRSGIVLAPDFAGGVYVAVNGASPATSSTYVNGFIQHLNSVGSQMWGSEGKSLFLDTCAGMYTGAVLVPFIGIRLQSSTSGVIASWQNSALVNARGMTASNGGNTWFNADCGVPPTSAGQYHSIYNAMPDATTGSLVGFRVDTGVTANDGFFVQRMDSAGLNSWGSTAVRWSTRSTPVARAVGIGNGFGGAIMGLQQSGSPYKIYLQGLNASGK